MSHVLKVIVQVTHEPNMTPVIHEIRLGVEHEKEAGCLFKNEGYPRHVAERMCLSWTRVGQLPGYPKYTYSLEPEVPRIPRIQQINEQVEKLTSHVKDALWACLVTPSTSNISYLQGYLACANNTGILLGSQLAWWSAFVNNARLPEETKHVLHMLKA